MAASLVLVVGSINMDLVYPSDRLPAPGETILGQDYKTYPGGKGANQAAAIGRLGGDVAFVGCIGTDAYAVELGASLIVAGVDHTLIREVKGNSGTAAILVDARGRNMIVVSPGANNKVTPEQVSQAIDERKPRIVLAQLEIPMPAVEAASKAERFILNPAPAAAIPDEILARCFVITPNESELETLTGVAPTDDETCLRASRVLLDKGVQNVVVTLGSRGSFWASAKGGQHFPAPKVEAIDTTAAGDAFNGALAMFLAQGRTLENAIPLANCVGALSTTRSGAQPSMPSLDELRGFAGPLY